MDEIRYVIALVLVMFAPGAFLFWFLVHPFIAFWRYIGIGVYRFALVCTLLPPAILVVIFRDALLGIEYGTQPVLMGVGFVLLIPTMYMRVAINRQMNAKSLAGLPEVAPDRYPLRLVTEGIYGKIRHPRYAQMVIAFLAYALISNYLAVYVMFAISVVWVWLLAPVEEKELCARFGDAYRQYTMRVPRFVPRLRE